MVIKEGGKGIVKVFKGHLLLNWKSGSMRIVKKRPSAISYTEIPISVNIMVRVPDGEEVKLEGEVTLSQAQVNSLVLEQF
jgi:hypothetical protein